MPRRYTDRDLIIIRNRQGEDLPVPPKRKKPDNEESRHQQAVVKWFDAVSMSTWRVPSTMLFAVPNGAKRGVITGSILKREGVRAGTSDLILLAMRGPYGGLALEMKKPGGVVSDSQQQFLMDAIVQGYAGRVAYSWGQAMDIITKYLNEEAVF